MVCGVCCGNKHREQRTKNQPQCEPKCRPYFPLTVIIHSRQTKMEIASLTFYMIGDNEISSHKWTTTCSEHYFQESVWHKRMKVSLSNIGLKKETLVSRLTFLNSDLKLLTDCQVKTTWKCSGETEVVQSDVIFLCRKVGHTAPCFSWKCDKMSVPGRRSRDIDTFHMWHEGKYDSL